MFTATGKLSYRVFFFTLYSPGLRLGEGIALKTGDIDAGKMRVHIRDAKGNKDRLVPLPRKTLHILREYWSVHRHPEFLFPNRKRGLKNAQLVKTPLDRSGIQTAMKSVVTQLGIKKISCHSLRHSYATHMLESGVDHELKVPGNSPKQWVVDCKSVGNGDKAIVYLGRYLYRGVIREKDILTCKDGRVTFRYLHAKSGKYRTRTVSGEKFLYLLMLHVLPRGFRRTRCYGFLHPCSKKLIRFLQLVLRINPFTMFSTKQAPRPGITCPYCGAKMTITATRITKPPSFQPAACPA